MPTEGRQSAYQYRDRRKRGNYEDDDESTASVNSGRSNGTATTEFANTHAVQNKLSVDAFLGTVAGRLAQEIHDEFLVCKICFDSYTNPKCLSCLHTFCAGCIERHISAEVTYNRYTDYRDFTCPLCRKRTQLPLGGVKRLPDNFLISGLTDLVMRQRASSHSSSSLTLTSGQNIRGLADGFDTNGSVNGDESCDQINQLPRIGRREILYGECEICAQVGWLDRGHSTEPVTKSNTIDESGRASSANLSAAPQASSKCLDCNKLLCADCVKRHRSTRVTKDHATFDLQSGKDIECKEHPGECVRFYCDACSECICVLCTFNDHREHEVTSFGEAVACIRTELEQCLEVTARRIANCQARTSVVKEIADLVHTLERQIHETTEHFIDLIQKQQEDMLHDLQEFVGSRNIEAIHQHEDQEHQIELAEELCRQTSKYLEGQQIDMLLAKPDLCAKIKQLNDMRLDDSDLDIITSDVYFRPGTVQLGFLTNDLSGPPTEQYDFLNLPLSSSQSSIELANRPFLNTTACQTDTNLMEKLPQKTKPKEEKTFRSQACNTEPPACCDQGTNTRPRGIHVSISYDTTKPSATSEEFLSQLDASKLDFKSMDNLTRARMRRKLREHYPTFDETTTTQVPTVTVLNGEKRRPPKGSADAAWRRYSAYDKHY